MLATYLQGSGASCPAAQWPSPSLTTDPCGPAPTHLCRGRAPPLVRLGDRPAAHGGGTGKHWQLHLSIHLPPPAIPAASQGRVVRWSRARTRWEDWNGGTCVDIAADVNSTVYVMDDCRRVLYSGKKGLRWLSGMLCCDVAAPRRRGNVSPCALSIAPGLACRPRHQRRLQQRVANGGEWASSAGH